MATQDSTLVEKRKQTFESFYKELIPTLVDFIARMGITPAHEVLKGAVHYTTHLDRALQDMAVTKDADRTWLLTRMGYYVGEYFAQKFGGAWYVNDLPGSRYYGRYVVGQFSSLGNPNIMIDPFEVARAYVDTPVPRQLSTLLAEVENELSLARKSKT